MPDEPTPGGVAGGVRPRILALMGSGETAPPMARVHRQLLARLGASPRGVILDTPYGFQENAAEISARAVDYFATSVGASMSVATVHDPGEGDAEPPAREAPGAALTRAEGLARLADADFVFAGPGSPSYALRQWRKTQVPSLLARKLQHGGLLTFASAAALTLGSHTVPVYEVYKVGVHPAWLSGLDLLADLGLAAAVIPHYDNTEGGTHDTRFCYLGERRLALLEEQLPAGHFVLGIDSHTALILDAAAGTAAVEGRGGVTVRVAGRRAVIAAGSSLPIADLPAIAARLATESAVVGMRGVPAQVLPGVAPTPSRPGSPLMDEVRELEARFESAAATPPADEGSVEDEALRVVLEMEALLEAWSSDTDTADLERARTVFQSLIVRLRGLRTVGAQRPGRDLPAVLVELLIDLRAKAREAQDWGLSDRIRDALAEAGIELRDHHEGTTWHVAGDEG